MGRHTMHTGTGLRLIFVAGVALAVISCGNVVRTGRSPVMLTINSIESATGASATLNSDVAVAHSDQAQAAIGVVMKDVTVTPTTNNQVSITRYHVAYQRADGRNVEGVDVPFAFDGAVTVTIPANLTGSVVFDIVRQVAKQEAPLAQLRQNPAVISVIANVTFFGSDQVGNDVSVTGSVLINFGKFSGS
jgi:hypothetical protein